MLGTVPVRTLLEREVTVAAARLAAFLAASLPRAEGVLADGVAFLEAMARPADCNGRPAEWRVVPAADEPLARLAAAFGLSSDEVGLLVRGLRLGRAV